MSDTDIAIVGIGMHEFGRTDGVSGMDQGVIAVRRAFDKVYRSMIWKPCQRGWKHFSAPVDPTRRATVRNYALMTDGYSRVMAKAEIGWSDGTTQTIVLRGDPPPDKTRRPAPRRSPGHVRRHDRKGVEGGHGGATRGARTPFRLGCVHDDGQPLMGRNRTLTRRVEDWYPGRSRPWFRCS